MNWSETTAAVTDRWPDSTSLKVSWYSNRDWCCFLGSSTQEFDFPKRKKEKQEKQCPLLYSFHMNIVMSIYTFKIRPHLCIFCVPEEYLT